MGFLYFLPSSGGGIEQKVNRKEKMSSENNEYKPRNTYQQYVCEERALMELGG